MTPLYLEMPILVALPVGAAVLALWFVGRYPGLIPDSLGVALVHFVFSLVLVELVPRSVAPLAAGGRPAGAVAFVLVLCTLVYAWLAVAAVLRTVHAAITE